MKKIQIFLLAFVIFISLSCTPKNEKKNSVFDTDPI